MSFRYVAWTAWAVLLVFSGCSPEPDGQASGLRLFSAPRLGLSLQIALSADTVAAGDTAGLYLQYYVVSGASSSRFDNSPGMFASRVERESGEVVDGEFVTHPLNRRMGNTRVVIPARGALGQVINLRCIQDAAGYGGDPLNPDVCLGFYKFDRPGPVPGDPPVRRPRPCSIRRARRGYAGGRTLRRSG